MARNRLAPLALVLMTSVGAVAAMTAAGPVLVGQAVAQERLPDPRPSGQLSDGELLDRIKANRGAIESGGADRRVLRAIRGQLEEDLQEQTSRAAGAEANKASEPEAKEQPAEQQAEPAPKEQQAEPAPKEQPAEQQAEPAPKEQPAEQNAAPAQQERPAEQQAAPAPKEQPAQRQAAPSTGEQPRKRKPDGDQAQPQRQAAPSGDQQQRDRRGGDQQGRNQQRSGADDRRAQELLNDRRDSGKLKDEPLRQRLEAIRQILGGGRVSDQYERALLKLLDGDREELRGRVRRNDDDRQRADRGRYDQRDGDRADRRELRELLRDDRPSRRLSDAELTARSDAARDALGDKRLRPEQVSQLRSMLQSDRQELRSRLRAEREERRRRLGNRNQAGGLRIEIRPGARPAPRRSIAAAEVDTREIERQLIAPPTRQIDRQYSFEEYARRPELRDVMPGIELDTIHFGFNEYAVREEEIDELDRIGETIERILATNPNEVFVVEGHTDAVGSDGYNFDLSRKRAAAVRDALLEYFIIEPANIETVGYGERYLKIPTELEEIENRRVTVRRITPILSRR